MNWAAEAMSVTARLARDVLVVKVVGFLTVESAETVRARIWRCPDITSARTLVIDLRIFTPVLGDDEWDLLAATSMRGGALRMPVALLVSAVHFDRFGGLCIRMANCGFMRAAFTSEVEALRWGEHWARYWHPDLREGLKASRAGAV